MDLRGRWTAVGSGGGEYGFEKNALKYIVLDTYVHKAHFDGCGRNYTPSRIGVWNPFDCRSRGNKTATGNRKRVRVE